MERKKSKGGSFTKSSETSPEVPEKVKEEHKVVKREQERQNGHSERHKSYCFFCFLLFCFVADSATLGTIGHLSRKRRLLSHHHSLATIQ